MHAPSAVLQCRLLCRVTQVFFHKAPDSFCYTHLTPNLTKPWNLIKFGNEICSFFRKNRLTLQVLHHVFLLLPLVFLLELSSNLFFPYNNIPWFGLCCPSLRKKRRWQALQFWFWVIPPPSHSQPRAKELHLGAQCLTLLLSMGHFAPWRNLSIFMTFKTLCWSKYQCNRIQTKSHSLIFPEESIGKGFRILSLLKKKVLLNKQRCENTQESIYWAKRL